MTLNDFVSKWNGKYVDTDNAYGAQCMDLMHQYCVEVLGLSQSVLAAPSAKEAYTGFSVTNLFEKIDNTPTGVPQEGDIIFWGNGTWGHVAIFVEGDANSFRSFDQNFPTGSPCHIQAHTSYSGVLGWLRSKGNGVQEALDKCVSDRNSHWNDLIAIADLLHVEVSRTVILAEITKLISYEDAVVQKDKQLTEAQSQIITLQKQSSDRELALVDLNKKVADLTIEVQSATNDNKMLQGALSDLKKQCTSPIFHGWKLKLYEWLKRV